MADDDEIEPREPEAGGAPGPSVLTSNKSSDEKPYRPGEADTVEWVEGIFNDNSQAKDELCDPDSWGNALAAYWGESWPDAVPSYKPRIVVNEIKALLLQELSDLTDSRVKIYAQRDFTKSPQRDEEVERSIQTYWTNTFCDMEILLASLDAMIYPLGFIQTGWDPTAKQGQGEVVYKHRDPATVFPDGTATGDDDVRTMILEDVEDLIQLRRDFPETGWAVKPEDAWSEKLKELKDRPAPRAGSGYTGPLYTKTGMGYSIPGYKKARARMLTCIVDDDERIAEINEIQGTLRQVRKLKYPHKRMIIIANRRVLYDDDNPFHYAPIITRVMMQPAVNAYWPSSSLVAEFAEIQATANKMDSLVAENMLRLNVGETFADADSGINPKTYGGIPGATYLIKPGSKVQKTYPQPMPGEMVTAGERTRGFIRSTMGYPLSRTGAGTHGNVAAELAETEISQAMGLTRLRGRLLYQSVQKSVQMIFARMSQFYNTPRHLPYIEDGDLKAVKWEPVVAPENYAIHLDEASYQVKSKTMQQRLALALAKMNKMPTGRLLKILEIPDADRIAAELKEELILQAAARMKQARAKAK